ncbi:MAG: methylmalonyl Co-A mutase-associated GTPase MeaB [Chloroflexi bacterium]|nr:methylmalonyl Co-A mutase-associated GTPase MeaB [Chloroflexota bacterium]MQC26993.1 methylmalonyl Co-A mutase-associated GTPase MeaB [Chloroflexota bacterium]
MDLKAILSGDRLALSRLLTQIEKDSEQGRQALNELFPHTGKAHLVGVTGAPGTGKSSLTNQLAKHYRNPPDGPARSVAVVAVDPSSPFSGGAVLGDRIRMQDLAGDPGVFIRSMATRGSLGGLATATAGLVQGLDAAGYEIILIETVGAGQAEVEVAKLAHTTIVVEAPGLGDDVQAIKAGILEIADILVLNKADRPGVEAAERALRGMLNLGHPIERVFNHHGRRAEIEVPHEESPTDKLWLPPLIRTVSTEGQGVPELAQAITEHRAFLETSGELQRRERARLESEVHDLLQKAMMNRWRQDTSDERYQRTLEQIAARKLSPRQAVAQLLNGSAPQ